MYYFTYFDIELMLYHVLKYIYLIFFSKCFLRQFNACLHFNILPSRLSVSKQLIQVNGKVIHVFKSIIHFQSRNKVRDSVSAAGWPPRTRHVWKRKKNRVVSSIGFFFFFFRNGEVIHIFFTGTKTWNRHQ